MPSLSQGFIGSYIHTGGRIGALVELNCETDFVARTDEFRTLAREIAMQVASMDPLSVGSMEGDAGDDDTVLLDQSCIREPGKTIRNLIRETIYKVGESIEVRRFARFEVGRATPPAQTTYGRGEHKVRPYHRWFVRRDWGWGLVRAYL